MIIKLTEKECVVRAERSGAYREGTWTIEGRKDGILSTRYRMPGNAAHVDIFAACETTLDGLVRDVPGEMQ